MYEKTLGMQGSGAKHTKVQGHHIHTICIGGEGSIFLSHWILPPVLRYFDAILGLHDNCQVFCL